MKRPGHVRVVELSRNFGQHSAILAGFRQSKGDIVVTLDADLQNPPEEIPRLIQAIDDGNDVVGGWREERQDQAFRRIASQFHNKLTSAIVGVPMHDYGCMLRAYRRHIVDTVVECDEKAAFVPALANSFAKRVAEIPVGHAERAAGSSKYNLLRLATLSLNLITGFSMIPIQMLSLMGIGVLFLDALLVLFLALHRLIYGPQEEGALWLLFTVLFGFVGLIFFALALIGEYIGRIYLEVRRRPTYLVRKVHGDDDDEAKTPVSRLVADSKSIDAAVKSARDAFCSRITTPATLSWRRCSRSARRSPRCSLIRMILTRKSGGARAPTSPRATRFRSSRPSTSMRMSSRTSRRFIPMSSTRSTIDTYCPTRF